MPILVGSKSRQCLTESSKNSNSESGKLRITGITRRQKRRLVTLGVAVWFLRCRASSTLHWTADFHLSVVHMSVARCCPFKGAKSFTFPFIHVKVGNNGCQWGAHGTAMFMSVETLVLLEICGIKAVCFTQSVVNQRPPPKDTVIVAGSTRSIRLKYAVSQTTRSALCA